MSMSCSVLLAEVIEEAKPGFACGEEATDGVFQIRMNNVTRDGRLNLGKRRLVPAHHKGIPSTLLQDRDVLFNATNSPDLVGKSLLVRHPSEPTVFSNHFLRLRVKENRLDAGYLTRWLNFQFQRGVYKAMCRQWVNQATLGRETLLGTSIPLPPVREQQRIAEVLDQADTLRERRRKAITLLDDLAQSVFLDMFGDPVTNPRSWPTRPLGSIGTVITGNTPPRSNGYNYGNSIEWIKSDNIDTSRVTLSRAVEGLSEYGMKSARMADAGSLLVTCIAGSPNSIGNVAVADRRVAFNQQINALTPFEADTFFLYMQLRVGKRLVQNASTGGMKGLVSKSRFEAIRMIDPPSALQQSFASKFNALNLVRQSNLAGMSELDALFTSLQSRAFAGQLWQDDVNVLVGEEVS